MKIFFNPAPMTSDVLQFPLEKVDVFIINEVEGQALTGQTSPDEILEVMSKHYPNAASLLTLGEKGAIYAYQTARFEVKARKVKAIDTTAAGDTFIGYFLASWVEGKNLQKCLDTATQASAICVTRKGGAVSIPDKDEVL
jgi:ribokinase